MPNHSLSAQTHREIHELLAAGWTVSAISEKLRCGKGTVSKFGKRPLPSSLPTNGQLPESLVEEYKPFEVGGEYKALVLCDVHIPFHVKAAVEAAVDRGIKAKVQVVVLNGDFLDCHLVSRFPHDGTKLTYGEEIKAGVQFLTYLRHKFPKARIICKEGNHEERLEKYILGRADALFGLVNLPELLQVKELGIEWVKDQRVLHLGKLRVIHGHEYGSGANAPVSAARWLMLRAGKPALCGHLHQTSEQIETNIDGSQLATWSVGCLCGLNPRYRRLNRKWNWGAAIVDVSRTGSFGVDNFRIMDGRAL